MKLSREQIEAIQADCQRRYEQRRWKESEQRARDENKQKAERRVPSEQDQQ